MKSIKFFKSEKNHFSKKYLETSKKPSVQISYRDLFRLLQPVVPIN